MQVAPACVECHAEISAAYDGHPMAHSIAAITDMVDWTVRTPPAEISTSEDVRYRVDAANGGMVHHEILEDGAGEVLYDHGVPVDFAIGSGRRGYSFLINQEGILTMSPLTWYTQEQRWDLSPGYSPNQHARFNRRVSDGCLSCHSGHIATADGADNRFAREVFPRRRSAASVVMDRGKDISTTSVRRAASRTPSSTLASLNQPPGMPSATSAICRECGGTGVRAAGSMTFGRASC